jgi:hypothetical protein
MWVLDLRSTAIETQIQAIKLICILRSFYDRRKNTFGLFVGHDRFTFAITIGVDTNDWPIILKLIGCK